MHGRGHEVERQSSEGRILRALLRESRHKRPSRGALPELLGSGRDLSLHLQCPLSLPLLLQSSSHRVARGGVCSETQKAPGLRLVEAAGAVACSEKTYTPTHNPLPHCCLRETTRRHRGHFSPQKVFAGAEEIRVLSLHRNSVENANPLERRRPGRGC